MKTNLTDQTNGQCEIQIKSYWILRSLKTNKSVVQPNPAQSLSLKWDQLSRLLPQRWRPLTRIHQQLTEVHPQRWSLTRRQPLCPCLPLASSPLHWQQPHVKWGDQGGTDQQVALQHPGLLQNRPYNDYSRLPHQLELSSSFHEAWWTTWLFNYYMVDLHFYSLNIIIIWFPVWPICLPAMTSAWYFKDTLRRKTQNFLIPKSHPSFDYQSPTSVIPPIKSLSYFWWNRGNFKASPA